MNRRSEDVGVKGGDIGVEGGGGKGGDIGVGGVKGV